jgi:hypothetical protein
MRAFEDWSGRTGATPGFFQAEAAGAWDVILDFQETRGLAGHCAEIGVWMGKSASMLALHARPQEHLVLVDPRIPTETRELLRSCAPSASMVFLEQLSSQPISAPESSGWPRAFRFVHIDGEHTGEALVNDLRLASQWLGNAGVICVDDFFNPMYPQLTAALFEHLAGHRHELTLFLCGHNKGYLCRPTVSHLYLGLIRSHLVKALAERGLLGVTVFKTTQASDLNCYGIGPRFKDLDYYGLDSDPSQLPA